MIFSESNTEPIWEFGLRTNIAKIKIMIIIYMNLTINAIPIERVLKFQYLLVTLKEM